MATVNLTGVIRFKPEDKPAHAVMGNVPTDAELPEQGITLMYGFREIADELKTVTRNAEMVGDKVNYVKVAVDVGDTKSLTPETLKDAKLLNMFAMTAALNKEIKQHWRNFLKDDGREIEFLEDDYFSGINYAARDPQYIGKLHQLEEFSHLDAICFPYLPPGSKIVSKRVTLFNADNVKEIENMSDPGIQVELQSLEPKRGRTRRA